MKESSNSPPPLNEKSCELNEAGRALLESWLRQIYPDGRPGFGEIFGSEIKRAWASDLFKAKKKGYHAEKIDTAFKNLEAIAKAKKVELPGKFEKSKHCQSFTKQNSSKKGSQNTKPETQRVETSSEQKLIQKLWDLNCTEQKYHFERNWKHCDSAALVSLHSKGELSQRWLVKRFAQKGVVNFKTAYKIPIKAGPYQPMVQEHSELWNEIARYMPGVKAQKHAIIEELCQIAQTQSVVMALYGLDSHTKRLQPLRKIVMEFWQELYAALDKHPPNPHSSHLALFLVGDIDTTNIFDTCTTSLATPETPYSLRLPDLTVIDRRDVKQWIGGVNDDVYGILSSLAKGVDIDEILGEELQQWGEAPDEVFRKLSALCGGVDLQSHWELDR